MTQEEKYQLALKALRYYASKDDETLCTLYDEDPCSYSTGDEGADEVAVAALMVLDEPVQVDEMVVYSLEDWQSMSNTLLD